jgi:hypothetical protein
MQSRIWRIFELNKDDVTGGLRKLHNVCSSPSVVRVVVVGGDEKCLQNLVGKLKRRDHSGYR